MNPEHELHHLAEVRPAPLPLSPVRQNLVLFVLTVLSVFYVGAVVHPSQAAESLSETFSWQVFSLGAPFAVPLLAILVTHEFGHFFAARYHRVPASFPYFIPFPVFPFGTMGAVIAMRGPIRSRNALLDVGASGPLAGLAVAIPALVWGLAHSEVRPMSVANYVQEGQSLFYWLMKRVAVGPIPEGHDVFLHPTAFAAWGGLFLTMLNLLPWGQLDGGHIAYSLIGESHHRIARWIQRGLLALFAYNLLYFVVPVLRGTSELPLSLAISNSPFWLMWFIVLSVIGRLSGGAEHPPVEPGELTPARKVVGWVCMVTFVLLFMPTPLASY